MKSLLIPLIMLGGAFLVLLNWQTESATPAWPYINVYSIVACLLGAYLLWQTRATASRAPGAALGVLGLAVAIQWGISGTGFDVVWTVIDFFLVLLLPLGAGLSVRCSGARET